MPFLSEKFDSAVKQYRDNVALVDEVGRSWTYGELGDDVRSLGEAHTG